MTNSGNATEEAIRKAQALVEALPYIRAFRGKVFVVKFGGAAMEVPATLESVLGDVLFLGAVGIRPILVHGGGPEITREMKARKIEPRFVRGHRLTDEATLQIVQDVLANRINAGICRRLEQLGGRPAAFANPAQGALRARRRSAKVQTPDGRTEEIDLGLVGDMVGIVESQFRTALEADLVPVVASLARGENGETLNVNADMVAACVAAGLRSEKAVFLTDTRGILTDPKDPASFADTLTEARIDELIRRGVIDGGMLPKVEACLAALKAGVRKTHIIDGRVQHALLLEIFTDKGVGTQIIH
jgi:acetylglutamate kinase